MSTTLYKGSTIQVTGPNAGADWSLSSAGFTTLDALETGIPVRKISFHSGASRDIVVVKDRNDGGPELARFECTSSLDRKTEYLFSQRCKPFIDISAGTHGKTVNSILTIFVE